MSSALVRQALEFVDPDDSVRGKNKKTKSSRPSVGQAEHHPYRSKRKDKQSDKKQKSEEDIAAENIRKLLALSQRTTDPKLTKKIVKRAVGKKPLVDKIEVPKDDGKSILFPDDG